MGGGYIPSVLANIGLVILVLLAVLVVHAFRMRAISKGETDEEKKKVVMRAIFDKFDEDGTGIELTEMQRICEKVDPNITVEQVENVFNKADADGGGIIDFEEFYAAVEATGASELDVGDIVDKAR